MYVLTKKQYDQLIINSITSTYKKLISNIKKQIKNTNIAIDWFKKNKKQAHINLQHLILKNFTSIKEHLLKNIINFTEQNTKYLKKTKQQYSTLENLYFSMASMLR